MWIYKVQLGFRFSACVPPDANCKGKDSTLQRAAWQVPFQHGTTRSPPDQTHESSASSHNTMCTTPLLPQEHTSNPRLRCVLQNSCPVHVNNIKTKKNRDRRRRCCVERWGHLTAESTPDPGRRLLSVLTRPLKTEGLWNEGLTAALQLLARKAQDPGTSSHSWHLRTGCWFRAKSISIMKTRGRKAQGSTGLPRCGAGGKWGAGEEHRPRQHLRLPDWLELRAGCSGQGDEVPATLGDVASVSCWLGLQALSCAPLHTALVTESGHHRPLLRKDEERDVDSVCRLNRGAAPGSVSWLCFLTSSKNNALLSRWRRDCRTGTRAQAQCEDLVTELHRLRASGQSTVYSVHAHSRVLYD